MAYFHGKPAKTKTHGVEWILITALPVLLPFAAHQYVFPAYCISPPEPLFTCANTHVDKVALVGVAVWWWKMPPSLPAPTFKNARSLICTPELGDRPDLLKALDIPRKNGERLKVSSKCSPQIHALHFCWHKQRCPLSLLSPNLSLFLEPIQLY